MEDQQKINLFAKYNAKHEDYKSEIKQKTVSNLLWQLAKADPCSCNWWVLAGINCKWLISQSELKNFDDAEDELMLRSDEDAAEAIPILIGGNFFYLSTEKATVCHLT